MPLNNPEFVEWQITLDEYKGAVRTNRRKLKTKLCDDEDMAHFYQFNDADGAYITELIKKNSLKCIDPSEEVQIRGKNDIDAIFLNIDLFVCNPEERRCSHRSLEDV
jgi:hypothetical protein